MKVIVKIVSELYYLVEEIGLFVRVIFGDINVSLGFCNMVFE